MFLTNIRNDLNIYIKEHELFYIIKKIMNFLFFKYFHLDQINSFSNKTFSMYFE